MIIKFEKYVLINGSKVFIHPNAMNCLKIIELLPEGEEITPMTLNKVLALFFRDDWKQFSNEEIFKAMNDFLFKRFNDFEGSKSERVFDIVKDFDAIYTGILRVYKIDIIEEEVHWWKFLLMLSDLDEENAISYRKKIRGTKLSDIKDPNQRSNISRAKESIRLTKKLSLEERNKRWRG